MANFINQALEEVVEVTNEEAARLLVFMYGHYRQSHSYNARLEKAISMACASLLNNTEECPK